MSSIDSTSHATIAPSLSTWALRGIALLFALAMGLYGVVALDTGYVNFKGSGNAEVVAQRLELRQSADSGTPLPATATITEHSGMGLAALAAVTPPHYAYGSQGLSEPLVHYAEMPTSHGYMLALHNTMGGLLMLFGALQFWPALRRRYPRWHRAFGMVYVGAAVVGMLAAMTYLVLTPVARIYDQFTFTIGLWLLAIGVLSSVGLSMHHLRRREIAQHQAYMAISYGFLLTAPLQRYGWMLLGVWQPELRQLEANYAVTAWLIPFSFLVGYGIFTSNRLLQARKPIAVMARAPQAFPQAMALGRWLAWLLLPALGAGFIALLHHFLLAPGLSAYVGDSATIPAGVLALDQAVIGNHLPSRLLFVAAGGGSLLLGVWLVWGSFLRQQPVPVVLGWGLVAGSAAAGLVMGYWGLHMGMPSFATLAGGATWLCGAAICLGLAAALAWALQAGEAAWVREWSLFTVLTLLGVPAFYLNFPVLLLITPPEYIESGHAFRLASYGQWFLLLAAFVYSAYSPATQERFAR
ncbi:MAG: DUF2306 domain-containing protein [Moraxellaceae bacterium]|nr:DUF2306 domain-containing protein [Moraxellaceae bacterium]